MPLPDRSNLPGHVQHRLIQKFFTDVQKTEGECWRWTGAVVSNRPFGRFGRQVDGHVVDTTAHRFAAAWFMEEDVEEGDVVVQRCGNTKCVRPSHLQVCESKREAIRVMSELGHSERGLALTREQAREAKWVLGRLGRVRDVERTNGYFGVGATTSLHRRVRAAERWYGSLDPNRPDAPLDRFLSPRRQDLARVKYLARQTDLNTGMIADRYDMHSENVSNLKHGTGSWSEEIPEIEPEWYDESDPEPVPA